MRGFITYESKQPHCRICGKLMDEWVLFIPESEQAHPECEGREFADKAIAKFRKGMAKETK